MEQWFQRELALVFLVYGFAFISMGVSIFVQPRMESSFKLSKIIWLLGLFGVIHGLNEWFDMLIFTHPTVYALKLLSFVCLVTSFAFLFEFGRQICQVIDSPFSIVRSRYLKWWIMPLSLGIIIVTSATSAEGIKSGQIMARYFLAFPGSFLTAAGFYYYRNEDDIFKYLKVDKYFLLTAVSFLAYAFLGGLVVPKGSLLLSSVVNHDSFLAHIHIPVQVFRALVAIVSAISITGLLKLFHWEATKKLLESNNELSNSKSSIIQNAKVQEVINRILKISLLHITLKEQMKQILDHVITVPWISLQSKGCIFLCENSDMLEIAAYHGFSSEQLNSCSHLTFGKCLCGKAALTKEVVFSSDSEDINHTIRYDDMKPHGHYCIPIIADEKVLGVINIYVNHDYIRNDNDEAFLKSIADTIAGIVIRNKADELLSYNYKIQNVINSILKLSLSRISLKEHLEKTLEIISTVPWLSAKETGCIFLIEDDPDVLVMKAHRGVSLQLFKTCGTLPIGKCLCGLAAQTGKTVFKSCLDGQHDVRFEGMNDHGHYCVPIKSQEKVLGVINLYVNAGHNKTAMEDFFFTSVAGVLAGIIERKSAEDKVEYLASYDSLTGLPNRLLFFDRLHHEITSAARFKFLVAVLYLDIDNFKQINDTMGHDVGDLFLKALSSRLVKCIRECDTLARMSGDEFTFILSNIKSVTDAENVANKIVSTLDEPFEIGNYKLNVTVSIGISIYPHDAKTASDLLKRADTAMYHAKKAGRNLSILFMPEMDNIMSEKLKLENELKLGLKYNEFTLHYQPQIDIHSGKIIGVEALIRWNHPARGLVSPVDFIPLAEDTGLIVPLGEFILFQSCRQSVLWQAMGLPPITMAVNISTRQISRQLNLIDTVFSVIYETQIEPKQLELELTESFCMQNVDSTITMLRKFNNMDILVTVDDFGTGYSSLSYLKYLPFKKLKIDRSFVKDITHDKDDLTIVRTIIDMAHNLRLKVIAEGVETNEQLEILRNLNCDEVQGFLFSKPVPQDEIVSMLREDYYCVYN